MLPVKLQVLQHQKNISSLERGEGKRRLGKNFYLLACYFLTVGLLSCGRLPPAAMNSISMGLGVNVANIRDIKPERDNDATVYLRGKVVRQVPLVDWRMYQLQDSTGKIWVLTNKADLRLQDQILIQGKVRYHSIPIEGKDFGEVYVEEQQQLERIPTR